jgi:Mn2+/Fe2+ NRAMP family transporter
MSDQVFRDREILQAAQEKGTASTLGAFLRLSGPGWLQSAITLGGGSLGSALYLGMLGGTGMLWVQLIAIIIGVIMLSAISYVTLSSGKRPYAAMNNYVNPVLGTAWITATILANMIFILAQFSLCFDALQQNLMPTLEDTEKNKLIVSGFIGIAALVIVLMSYKPGAASKMFDWILKLIVGFVVLCFVGAVVVLFQQGTVDWSAIGAGFIPSWDSWNTLSPELASLSQGLDSAEYWSEEVRKSRQDSVISAAAAAVGINMTFLLPYSMLARGWDRTFRGLARWDLVTGMAIPFVLVTSCIVISSASAFHGKADENMLSSDPAVVQQSDFFGGLSKPILKRIGTLEGSEQAERLAEINAMPTDAKDPETKKEQAGAKKEALNSLSAAFISEMSENERKLALSTVKPNSKLLALSLKPLLKDYSDLVFGLGALAMGFSTIVVLMLINGYAFAEIAGRYESRTVRSFGAIVALAAGISWVWFWAGASKTYLLIVAGTFAVVLLPIAYFAFFLMMNNSALLGTEKPRGLRMVIWNVLMIIGVAGAVAAAYVSIRGRLEANGDLNDGLILGGIITFLLLMVIGFSARRVGGKAKS